MKGQECEAIMTSLSLLNWKAHRFCKVNKQMFPQGNAQRPEVRVVTWNNDELSTDALPVHGFEHYKAKDYSLAHTPFSG